MGYLQRMTGVLKRIHVNQHHIRHNGKGNAPLPVLTVKVRGRTLTGDRCDVLGESVVVYRPDKPLSCGAKVWIETRAPIVLDGNRIY